MGQQAIDYWQQAGEYANRHYAHIEAISHLHQGLAVLATLPETAARVDREIRLYLAMGPPLLYAKGHADSEVGRVYARVRELCHHGEDVALHTSALLGPGVRNRTSTPWTLGPSSAAASRGTIRTDRSMSFGRAEMWSRSVQGTPCLCRRSSTRSGRAGPELEVT